MSVFIPKAHKPNQTTIVWDKNFNYPKDFDLNNEVYNPYSNTHKITFSTGTEVAREV